MENRAKNTFALLTIALAVAVQCISAEVNLTNTALNAGSGLHPAASENTGTTNSPASSVSDSLPAANVAKPEVASVATPLKNIAATTGVQIEVYYEALCSDSVTFVASELLPVHSKLSKFINVTFIPFAQGKIVESDKVFNLTCRRESAECDADKVHACGINKITDSDKLFKFVNCALTEGFKNSTKVVPIDVCGKNSGIETDIVNAITTCAQGTESYPWLQNYENMSFKAQVKTVPKVLVNQVATEDLTSSNLMKLVCARIPEKDLPADCKAIDSGSDTLIVGVLPIIIGAFYIIKMI